MAHPKLILEDGNPQFPITATQQTHPFTTGEESEYTPYVGLSGTALHDFGDKTDEEIVSELGGAAIEVRKQSAIQERGGIPWLLHSLTRGIPATADFLTNPFMQVGARALEKIQDVPQGTYDGEWFKRWLLSAEYEEVKQLMGGIQLGEGEYVGPQSDLEQLLSAPSEGIGLAGPFMGITQRAARLAVQNGITSDAMVPFLKDPEKWPILQPQFWEGIRRLMMRGYIDPKTAGHQTLLEMGFSVLAQMGAKAEQLFSPWPYTGLVALSPLAIPGMIQTVPLIGKLPGIRFLTHWAKTGYDKGKEVAKRGQDEAAARRQMAGEEPENLNTARAVEINNEIRTSLDEVLSTQEARTQMNTAAGTEALLKRYADDPEMITFTLAERSMVEELLEGQVQRTMAGIKNPALKHQENQRKMAFLSAARNLINRSVAPSEHLDQPPIIFLDESIKESPQYKAMVNTETEIAELAHVNDAIARANIARRARSPDTEAETEALGTLEAERAAWTEGQAIRAVEQERAAAADKATGTTTTGSYDLWTSIDELAAAEAAATSPDIIPTTPAGRLRQQLHVWGDSMGEKAAFPASSTETRAASGADLRETISKMYNAAMENVNKFARLKKIENTWKKDVAQIHASRAKEELVLSIPSLRKAASNTKGTGVGGAVTWEDISRTQSQVLNKIDRTVFDFLNHPNNDFTWAQTLAFRRQVMQDIVEAQAKGRRADESTALMKVLDNFMENYGVTNANLRIYNQRWQDEVVSPYLGTMTKIAQTADGSTPQNPIYRIQSENVADEFLKNSRMAGAFRNLFWGDDIRMGHLRNAVYDRINTNAFDETVGAVTPKKVDIWINKNEDILKAAGLWDEFSTKAKAGGFLENELFLRQAVLAKNEASTNGNLMFKALNKAFDIESPNSFFDDILKNPKIARQTKETVESAVTETNNPQLMDAFKAHTWRAVERATQNEAGENFVFSDPDRFVRYLANKEEVLTNIYGKEHLDNIVGVADAIKRLMASGPWTVGSPIDMKGTIEKVTAAVGLSPASFSTRMLAVHEKRVGKAFASFYVLSRALSARQHDRADQIMEKVLFDPTFAKKMNTQVSDSTLSSGKLPKKDRAYYNNALSTMGYLDDRLELGEGAEPEIIRLGSEREIDPDALYKPQYRATPTGPEEIKRPPSEINPYYPRLRGLPAPDVPTSMQLPSPQNLSPQNLKASRYAAAFPEDELGQAVAGGGLGSLV